MPDGITNYLDPKEFAYLRDPHSGEDDGKNVRWVLEYGQKIHVPQSCTGMFNLGMSLGVYTWYLAGSFAAIHIRRQSFRSSWSP